MSRFFVGQLVRLRYVRDTDFTDLVGRQCRVIGVGPYEPGLGDGFWFTCAGDYRVEIEGYAGGPGQFLADQLEPLIPPHEASQYSYTELMERLKAGEVECV